MEDDLERVAENQKDWKLLIREFWEDFHPTLEIALKEAFVPKVMTDIDCPKCKEGKLQKIWARSKYFYGCSRYPDCDYSAPIEEISFNKEDYAADFNWEQPCPLCSTSPMKVRHGRYGTFLGCTRYPECKGIVNIPKKGEQVISQENLPPCPAIDCPGVMVGRKSRFGKIFYSCSTYPECDVIVNTLEQLETKYPDHPRTPYVKKDKKGSKKSPAAKKTASKTAKTATKTKTTVKKKTAVKEKATKEKATKEKKTRKMPSYSLTGELAAIVGETELTRGEVTKKVWDYIKSHELQDAANKRMIRPDASLAKVLGTNEPVDMFKMTSLINVHIKKKE
jgi:DNA topoisomerase-1